MNYDLLFAILFYGLILFLFFKYREKFIVQGKIIILYKTKIGLKLMDRLANIWPKAWHYTGYLSILVGFLGMGTMFWILLKGAIDLIKIPESIPVVAPILPGVAVPGLPTLSFWHWVIAILVVATVHEFCHGIYARVHKIKIKSSGGLLLGPIIGAFVEPDEKQMSKKSKFAQLSVISAGPFSNIVLGIIIMLIGGFILAPITSNMLDYQGVQIVSVTDGLPISETTLSSGDVIEQINGIDIVNQEKFMAVLSLMNPGDEINLKVADNIITTNLIENPKKKGKPLLGVTVTHAKMDLKQSIKDKYGDKLPWSIFWIAKLVFWLYVINLGVGLFNLLPLGFVDGGRMFYLAALFLTKDNVKKATKAFHFITLISLFLIFVNLLPYIIKLLAFMFSPIALFF